MFQSPDLLVLSCLVLTVEIHTGHILPPRNLSLRWITDFEPELSWTPPKHSINNCTYLVAVRTNDNENDSEVTETSPPWTEYKLMHGGFLHFSVQTVCDEKESDPERFVVTYPELVRDLQCYIHSSTQTHCSWTPAIPAPDLCFFYRLVNEDRTVSIDSQSGFPVQACSSYTHTDGVRTGCDLQAKVTQDVHIVFNGTVNNEPVKNTFKRELQSNVRPPALEWEVQKTGTKFLISWTPPDISNPPNWKFMIKYTECGKTLPELVLEGKEAELPVVSHCPYHMSIRAVARGAATPWSQEKYFNADSDPNALLYAAILIPLIAATLGALTFICLMKHKNIIFPKVPQPRDLLGDSDNNNKAALPSLYNQAEEEHCEITLVVDP
ncbi:uncharacterized protein [Brachionichthys hirsutus]|uniref:uncharacterized protein n=1 Tax=Brachionichthys hirsutus TaxID=412623 RepID=UPI003604CC98